MCFRYKSSLCAVLKLELAKSLTASKGSPCPGCLVWIRCSTLDSYNKQQKKHMRKCTYACSKYATVSKKAVESIKK